MFQSSISFVTVIFLIMPKARRSSASLLEAEAVENSSVIHPELKMPAKRAKMGHFTPKCPERDEQGPNILFVM